MVLRVLCASLQCVFRLAFDNDVIIMGDFNADLSSEGSPLSSTSMNVRGQMLLRFLQRWNYLSVHLYHKAPGLLQSVTHHCIQIIHTFFEVVSTPRASWQINRKKTDWAVCSNKPDAYSSVSGDISQLLNIRM